MGLSRYLQLLTILTFSENMRGRQPREAEKALRLAISDLLWHPCRIRLFYKLGHQLDVDPGKSQGNRTILFGLFSNVLVCFFVRRIWPPSSPKDPSM